MKLLIVDDEELTRTGVISSIDWNSLGIDEVIQADDGINGLEAARIHKPEIILCDVRMPRMDGITMLERLESLLPDTVPIFMSGYSDKDYLKAAIKLKAISYIEKPLDPQEIREAVQEARDLYLQKLRSHRGETLHSMETASRLALQLTVPYGANNEIIEHLCGELALHLTAGTYFTAFIVKLNTSLELAEPSKGDIYQALKDFLKHYHMECIYVEKHIQYLVYYVFGSSRPTGPVLQAIGDFFGRMYASCGKYFIAAGDTYCGISRAYHSYASAVILLQSSFFFPSNTFLTGAAMKNIPATRLALPSAPENIFAQALASKNKASCTELLETLFRYFDKNTTLLQNQVKDTYYKLFLALEDTRKQLMVSGSGSESGSIVDDIEGYFTYGELHQALVLKTESFFNDAQNSVQENPTIFLIKDYISQNYMNEGLSVKDISTHVFLSTSYVCTFFKSETGQTLNQYLTEYRMERAKQLLCDPRYKISDISSKVGYSDGNYFGKSFKKYSGLSPSEYREKMTS
ncbi:MAG: response regulator [Eubacteriales bacterium]|nr:response regulator [Eubacteriales bacterium]